MKPTLSRRDILRAGALATAACAASGIAGAWRLTSPPTDDLLPVRLGLASYTFRNFSRAQMIGFMKQLNLHALNVKDVKDHLPMDPSEETGALQDYTAAHIRLHAAGAISFAKDENADLRRKFEYCRRAGISMIVAGDPAPEALPHIEKLAQEYDIRIAIHNHGPEDSVWHSPLDVLQAIRNMDVRLGSCMDVGHAVRAGTDVVQAIHQLGPRLFNVHMKDLANFQSKESQVPVGDGLMPVREIFEALIATRYEGFVDLEYEVHPDDPMPGVTRSFACMRGVLAGTGVRAVSGAP